MSLRLALALSAILVILALSGCAYETRVEQVCQYPEWTAAPTVCCYHGCEI
jgi:hypothetical protein